MAPKISIIVTIYNSEKYLARCLDSIKNQTYSDFEVILVNDGSTDNSELICREFVSTDNRFRLYNKENGGNASASIYGFQLAEGEYFSVIDSDDYIHERYCEVLNDMTLTCTFDVLNFGYKYVKNDIEDHRVSVLPKHHLIDQSIMHEYLKSTAHKMILWFTWSFLFRKAFLIENNITWSTSVKIGTDTYFNLQCLYHSKATYSIEEPLYYYVYNPTSLTQSAFKSNLLSNYESQFSKRVEFHQKNTLIDGPEYYKDIAQNYLEHAFFMLLNNLRHSNADINHELEKIRKSVIYRFSFQYYSPSTIATLKMRMIIYLFKNGMNRLLFLLYKL